MALFGKSNKFEYIFADAVNFRPSPCKTADELVNLVEDENHRLGMSHLGGAVNIYKYKGDVTICALHLDFPLPKSTDFDDLLEVFYEKTPQFIDPPLRPEEEQGSVLALEWGSDWQQEATPMVNQRSIGDLMQVVDYRNEEQGVVDSPLDQPLLCVRCGTPLPANAVFCSRCGQSVEEIYTGEPVALTSSIDEDLSYAASLSTSLSENKATDMLSERVSETQARASASASFSESLSLSADLVSHSLSEAVAKSEMASAETEFSMLESESLSESASLLDFLTSISDSMMGKESAFESAANALDASDFELPPVADKVEPENTEASSDLFKEMNGLVNAYRQKHHQISTDLEEEYKVTLQALDKELEAEKTVRLATEEKRHAGALQTIDAHVDAMRQTRLNEINESHSKRLSEALATHKSSVYRELRERFNKLLE